MRYFEVEVWLCAHCSFPIDDGSILIWEQPSVHGHAEVTAIIVKQMPANGITIDELDPKNEFQQAIISKL